MDIGAYTFKEFHRLAENFHGYAAPGLLVGGYMVELAKRHLPEGTLFEAVVESGKCLPDAVQLLTLCRFTIWAATLCRCLTSTLARACA